MDRVSFAIDLGIHVRLIYRCLSNKGGVCPRLMECTCLTDGQIIQVSLYKCSGSCIQPMNKGNEPFKA